MPKLTSEEAKDLEYFLNLMLFENHGAFVLLGSKPMSSMTLIDTESGERIWKEKYAQMSDQEKAKWDTLLNEAKKRGDIYEKAFQRNPFNGWLVWNRISSNKMPDRFLTIVKQQGEGTAFFDLLFVDVAKVSTVLTKHYDYFKEITDQDFDPTGIVYELKNPKSPFWDKVFLLENHFGKGLLFGYGEANAYFFDNQLKHQANSSDDQYLKVRRSIDKDIEIGQGCLKNFAIPRFSVSDDTEVKKYQSEKQEIEAYFKHKSLIRQTLFKIASR